MNTTGPTRSSLWITASLLPVGIIAAGVVLQVIGYFFQDGVSGSIGYGLALVGFALYARARGCRIWWVLVGVLPIIGPLVGYALLRRRPPVPTTSANERSRRSSKQVGIGLGFGILVMPYLCAWLLLNSGYSRRARILGFGWLAAFVAIAITHFNGESKRAEASAKTFCARFTVGGSFEQAVVAAKSQAADDKGHYKDTNGGDIVFVRYISGIPLGWHICEIKGTEGKISNIGYSLYILK